MAQGVILHVGAMKSGTSFLQRLLFANRAALAGHGVLLPGKSWSAQVRGVTDVLERQRVVAHPREGAWQTLVDEIGAWPGTAVISMEFLGQAGPGKINRVVSSLEPGTVQVVVTARDLTRNVPAMWQESLKNGRSHTFDDYVAAIGDGVGPGARFWREQNIAGICRRWGEAVGFDRVVLVTVPPPGAAPDVLWRRFASAIALGPVEVTLPTPSNESLGAASAAVLRRLNDQLHDLGFGSYAPIVKHQLAKQVMGTRRTQEDAVGFEAPSWLRERSATMNLRLAQLGIQVLGDLADLEPQTVPGVDPGAVTLSDQLAAAVSALEGIVRLNAADRQIG